MSFRPNVAGILQRPDDGKILIAERVDVAGAWQFPQGGVDPGEDLEEALRREMLEELGLPEDAYRIGECFGPYNYWFGGGRKKKGFSGQKQNCFLLPYTGSDSQIRVDTHNPEFVAIRWIYPEEFDLGWVPEFKIELFKNIFRDVFSVGL